MILKLLIIYGAVGFVAAPCMLMDIWLVKRKAIRFLHIVGALLWPLAILYAFGVALCGIPKKWSRFWRENQNRLQEEKHARKIRQGKKVRNQIHLPKAKWVND